MTLPTMPPVIERRPLDDDDPDGYAESDRDWFENNRDAVLWFLDNHKEVRFAVEMLT